MREHLQKATSSTCSYQILDGSLNIQSIATPSICNQSERAVTMTHFRDMFCEYVHEQGLAN